ncbi:uncharacterized protein LOC124300723 [Neodiprion virginianus]|uniref:uncharacterized protein LOC124300723 n=1 Tax=Neodiprion virginianus TaxID=2961670 RepID=UPI001EE6C70F|nr:uncharacterized protein LOC124300723 [Neodiprion virginianus]
MKINPLNVIRMLLATFEVMRLPDSPVNNDEIQLKANFENILLSAVNEYSGFEMVEENSLHFEEPFKDWEMEIVEDKEWANALYESELSPDTCTRDNEDLSYEYKLRAVEYWRSGKKGNLGLGSVKQKCKKVQSIRQLHRWAHNLTKGETYKKKLARICGYTFERFKAAVDAGLIVHDSDLKKWAFHAQKEIRHTDFRFKASHTWINSFKAAHRIVSRKIHKFITSKTIEDGKVLEQQIQKFVYDVKLNIRTYGLSNTFNAQSGCQLEMHSGRTLAVKGEKQVQCLVQSVYSTSHSYTIQPTISADGKLLSPRFLVLKEPTGKIGPIVEKTLFRPDNVYIEVSKSGKLTSDYFKIWLQHVIFPKVGSKSLLLIDSWTGHCPHVVRDVKPSNRDVKVMIIPKGITGKIQPLDVFGFRVWKNFVRHFSDNCLLMNYDIDSHLRNNIIKLQSLVHNQLSSPRYIDLFK